MYRAAIARTAMCHLWRPRTQAALYPHVRMLWSTVSGMDTVIVFDVNETLLDLGIVRSWFSRRFAGDPTASTWFSELLRLSFVSSVTDRYTPFTDLAAAALETVAEQHNTALAPEDLTKIKDILATLPAHRDTVEGLTCLTDSGYTLAALTNSPLPTATAQLDHAGIAHFFDTVMSVDMVQRFKPHRSVYLAAADRLSTPPADLVMVAAHDWDISGAMAAGLDGVFVERSGQIYSPSFPPPTLTAPDIARAATAIITRYSPR